MKLRRSIIVLAVALIVSLGFTSCRDRDGGATHVLMMSTQLADTSPMVGGFRAWADAVYERTNGNVRIDIFTNAVLGSDEDVIEQASRALTWRFLPTAGAWRTMYGISALSAWPISPMTTKN